MFDYHDKGKQFPGDEVAEEDSQISRFSLFDYVHAYAVLPFLVFHVSLIVCVCAAGRSDSTFRDGFFVIFTALSIVDAFVVMHVSIERDKTMGSGEDGRALLERGAIFLDGN